MRIISGTFKGKKILEPLDKNTRPLKDLTKESIFNIITHSSKFKISLNNSIILDIFAGVGSFGIECLSRGVKKVIFIENYNLVLSVLKKNLKSLKSINNYKIIEEDIYNYKVLFNLNSKFDIIFLDPPYKNKKIDELLKIIKDINILNDNGVIILHRHKKEKDFFSNNIKILEEKNYGISKIIFLTFL